MDRALVLGVIRSCLVLALVAGCAAPTTESAAADPELGATGKADGIEHRELLLDQLRPGDILAYPGIDHVAVYTAAREGPDAITVEALGDGIADMPVNYAPRLSVSAEHADRRFHVLRPATRVLGENIAMWAVWLQRARPAYSNFEYSEDFFEDVDAWAEAVADAEAGELGVNDAAFVYLAVRLGLNVQHPEVDIGAAELPGGHAYPRGRFETVRSVRTAVWPSACVSGVDCRPIGFEDHEAETDIAPELFFLAVTESESPLMYAGTVAPPEHFTAN